LTSLLVNNQWLDDLEGRCNKQHKHKPWVPVVQDNKLHFATKEEVAYPWLLCERIVHAIRIAIENKELQFTKLLNNNFLTSIKSQLNDLSLELSLEE